MSDTIRMMQSRFPNIYNVYDENTIIYTLLMVYADRMDNNTSIIDRINNMIDIDSTSNEDLEHRWGSMLGIYRMNGESYFNQCVSYRLDGNSIEDSIDKVEDQEDPEHSFDSGIER